MAHYLHDTLLSLHWKFAVSSSGVFLKVAVTASIWLSHTCLSSSATCIKLYVNWAPLKLASNMADWKLHRLSKSTFSRGLVGTCSIVCFVRRNYEHLIDEHRVCLSICPSLRDVHCTKTVQDWPTGSWCALKSNGHVRSSFRCVPCHGTLDC